MSARVPAFVTVGAGGFALQMAVLWLLGGLLHWPYPLATLLAVEAAVLHNFVWHERWTWSDRRPLPATRARRLVRYHAGTGLASLIGNVVLTALAVEWLEWPMLAANAAAVAGTSAANFILADRWVFRAPATASFLVVLVVSGCSTLQAAELRPATVQAWDRHVAEVERTVDTTLASPAGSAPESRRVSVPGGTIHEWRGSVTIRALAVGPLVDALETPGLPPPSEDVLDARVLSKEGHQLQVYLKIARSAIVSVTYDTVHDVAFTWQSPHVVTSRSIATRIREDGGSDHGFLWRLNSYWRYEQRGPDVVVTLLSLSLSRDVPALVRPIAGPIIDGIARESMTRTLEAVERFGRQRSGARNTSACQAFGARTSTPEDCRPARIHAASDGAPAVSPWMHSESASSCTVVPSTATTVRSTAICMARVTTSSTPAMTLPGVVRGTRDPSG